MIDRIFAGAVLLVALAYVVLAFTVIGAPFQYDPLGPESWPRIIGSLAVLCCAALIIRPEIEDFSASKQTLLRLAILVGMLCAYAFLFKPLGFIISTTMFSFALSKFLGARVKPAGLFAVSAGVGGYVLCKMILDLNLPSGILKQFL
ncbi:tripartite tricarboxylate transporter TctB family protein [Maritalea porphyrae]|uniref:tripartite tricarboxylate transporter TctB family protein n=1 Tax=Maritalea porphyrae TaxID=880732 RepID=UPI0022AEC71E|nr:tripartite tricarboxylate transporter TctB family protein [Maritalea porphyrae]MCZ4271684.1 tripartite tricarboxylate transporter TctB family protein [Maritalea porphyrae]